MKKCKQCGKMLDDSKFRQYYPRGTGQRKTTVGHNTVCLECEHLNTTTTRIWKSDKRTEKDEMLLTQAAEYYKMLVDNGNEPIGAYAKHVLGVAVTKQPCVDDMLSKLTSSLQMVDADYDALLQLELTDEPDVYQEMLDALRERCLGSNGKVQLRYVDKFEAVARRFDDYEDSYVW